MDIIGTLNKSIITLKSLRPNVDQINDITLPIINVVNAIAAVRDVLVSQQEENAVETMQKENAIAPEQEENHENDHNEERDV